MGLGSPLKKSIRSAAGPCGRITALRSLPESTYSTRPRLQSDFINGRLGIDLEGVIAK